MSNYLVKKKVDFIIKWTSKCNFHLFTLKILLFYRNLFLQQTHTGIFRHWFIVLLRSGNFEKPTQLSENKQTSFSVWKKNLPFFHTTATDLFCFRRISRLLVSKESRMSLEDKITPFCVSLTCGRTGWVNDGNFYYVQSLFTCGTYQWPKLFQEFHSFHLLVVFRRLPLANVL